MSIQYFLILFFLTVGSIRLPGQPVTPERLGFRADTIRDEKWGVIHYYVSADSIGAAKPVLLYLDGSGPYPLFQYTERGIGSSVVFDFMALSADYHIVLISKPGVPFIDSVKMDSGRPYYAPPPAYRQRLSLDWRVQSARLVLDRVVRDYVVDTSKIAVLGISEGFQVGAKLASSEDRITHAILMAGNGLNQFFDFILHNRTDAQCEVISVEEAQMNIDSLLESFSAIYADPLATDKEWYGHTYLRWSSFTQNNPTENILSLDIPVYIAAASRDRNTSVLGTDYLYLESLKSGKKNLIYKVYPYDHSFNEWTRDAEGRVTGVKGHMQEVIKEAMDWLAGQ